MIACCPKIEFLCGPRHNLLPVDLITAFNLFLYFVEIKSIDPVRSAEKVLAATDLRLVCYDRIETCAENSYASHCELISERIITSFKQVVDHEIERFGEPKSYDFQSKHKNYLSCYFKLEATKKKYALNKTCC